MNCGWILYIQSADITAIPLNTYTYSMHLQVCTHTTNKISSIIEASIWLNSYIPSNYAQSLISIPSDEPCDWPVDQYGN